MEKFWVVVLVLFCALLGAVGQIFFKLASKSVTVNILSWVANWKLILGLFLYAVATVLFVMVLKFGNVSILYPVIATSYIWVVIFASIFLKEPFGLVKWVGIFFIILGVAFIVR